MSAFRTSPRRFFSRGTLQWYWKKSWTTPRQFRQGNLDHPLPYNFIFLGVPGSDFFQCLHKNGGGIPIKLGLVEKIDHPAIVEWSSCDIERFCRPPHSNIGTIPRQPRGIFFWRVRHSPTTFSNEIALSRKKTHGKKYLGGRWPPWEKSFYTGLLHAWEKIMEQIQEAKFYLEPPPPVPKMSNASRQVIS